MFSKIFSRQPPEDPNQPYMSWDPNRSSLPSSTIRNVCQNDLLDVHSSNDPRFNSRFAPQAPPFASTQLPVDPFASASGHACSQHSCCSGNQQSRKRKYSPSKVSTFKLSDEIDDWLIEFNTYCKLQQIDNYDDLEDKVAHLIMLLSSDARRIYNKDVNLSAYARRYTWDDVETRLRRLFGQQSKPTAVPFENRTQAPNESLTDFMSALLKTVKTAYPTINEDAQNALVLSRFVNGVSNDAVHMALAAARVGSIADALAVASAAETSSRTRGHTLQNGHHVPDIDHPRGDRARPLQVQLDDDMLARFRQFLAFERAAQGQQCPPFVQHHINHIAGPTQPQHGYSNPPAPGVQIVGSQQATSRSDSQYGRSSRPFTHQEPGQNSRRYGPPNGHRSPSNRPLRTFCEFHQRPGHDTQDCRALRYQQSRDQQSYSYQQPSQFQTPPPPSPQAGPPSLSPGVLPSTSASANNQQQMPTVNHVARDEPARHERVVKINPASSKGIVIGCQLNGVQVDALLDTGSDYTLVSDRLYPKLNVLSERLDPCPLSGVQTATGEPVALLGQFSCRLETRSLNLITDVIVVKDLKLECLLGQNVAEHLPGYNAFLDSLRRESLALLPPVPVTNRRLVHALLYAPTELTDKYLTSFLEHYQSLFSQSVEDLTGTDIVEHDIVLASEKTIKEAMRRIPYHLRAEVERNINDLLKAGIIVPSQSNWAFPLVIVRKKTGEIRVCIDYRSLNAITVRDVYPIPRLDDILDSFHGVVYFTTLDCASGYHQIKMRDSARAKTAFVCHLGLFEFVRMPFGLTNAPSTFQ
jgi:hypothetical protein